MLNSEQLIKQLANLNSIDGKGDNTNLQPFGLTLGIVVDTDDPLEQKRYRIFCPSLNDNPKKLHQLPWTVSTNPFGGSINNAEYARGHDTGNYKSSGPMQYGAWFPLEQGTQVVVACLNGDIRRRVCLGAIYEHQETHGVLTGRWKHGSSGSIDGPLTSTDQPLEPEYTNNLKAFGSNTSREWRTRAAEYQGSAVREDVGEVPNDVKKTYLDAQNNLIVQYEPDPWVKDAVGAHGYDWTGYKGLGAFKNSRLYGFSTPGNHRLLMNDAPYNSRVKLKTTAGHQIILDDTNERIYINTYEGNSWIEMDKSGNIDVYAKRRLSFHGEKDINISSDETVRILGKKGIHMYAGYDEGQEDLPNVPEDGEIRIQATSDIHMTTHKVLRQLSFGDTLVEIGGKKCESIGESLFLQVENDINIITNEGDMMTSVSGNLHEVVKYNVSRFAAGTNSIVAKGDTQIHSFEGKVDIGAQKILNMKSISEDVYIEAVGKNSGAEAGVVLRSPQSQYSVSHTGISSSTNKTIKSKAKDPIEFEQGPDAQTPQEPPIPPAPPEIGDCNIGGPLPLTGTNAEKAAAAAYNAGFRGDALVTAVAIASGESGYNPNAIGDTALTSSKWGPSVGMWQGRTLQNPDAYSGLDNQRNINALLGDSNIQNNANFAFGLSKGGTNFRPWTVYTKGIYKNPEHYNGAVNIVNNMCNPGGSGEALLQEPAKTSPVFFTDAFAETSSLASLVCGQSLLGQCNLNLNALSNTSASFSLDGGINMQAVTDIAMKSASDAMSQMMFGGVIKNLNDLTTSHLYSVVLNALTSAISSLGPVAQMAADAAHLAALLPTLPAMFNSLNLELPSFPIDIDFPLPGVPAVDILKDLALNILLQPLCNLEIPDFGQDIRLDVNKFLGIDANAVYQFANFDICGGTL